MRYLIAGTLAAGILLAASPTFAQTPTTHSTTDKSAEKAEHKAEWKDCMEKMEGNNKGHEKPEGAHKGTGPTAPTAPTATTSKDTEKSEAKAEERKMEREKMKQACREQLYGKK
jgi:hypothetical protein